MTKASEVYNKSVDAHNNRPSSKAELEEKSWEFLPKVTDAVAALAKSVQDQILVYGTKLNAVGMTYIHVVGTAPRELKGQALIKSQEKFLEDTSKGGMSASAS
jgi:hypothetical protein